MRVSFRFRLIAPVTAAIVVCMLVLIATIVSIQKNAGLRLDSEAKVAFDTANNEMKGALTSLQKQLGDALTAMETSTKNGVSDSTRSALQVEQDHLKGRLLQNHAENARTLAKILASSGATPIYNEDLSQLNSIVMAAHSDPALVFAIYLNQQQAPLTRYLNRKNAKVLKYIGSEKIEVNRIIKAAENDSEVVVVSQEIDFGGQKLGHLVIAMDTAPVTQAVQEMTQRFQGTIASNSEVIGKLLTSQSQAVNQTLQSTVQEVNAKNEKNATGMRQGFTAINHANLNGTQLSLMVGGVICVGFVLIILVFNANAILSILKRLQGETGRLTEAAKLGRLSTRGEITVVPSEFQGIIQGINETLDAVITPLNMAAESVKRIAMGDVPPLITERYEGDFNVLKNNINTCINAVNALIEDANALAESAINGHLSSRTIVTRSRLNLLKILK